MDQEIGTSAGVGRIGTRATEAARCDVLHVVWPGGRGGIPRQVAGIVRMAPGHRVCFLNGDGAIGHELAAEGLAVRLFIRRGWAPRSVWRLGRTLRHVRPRIVHLHSDDSLAVPLVSALVLPRARRVYTERSPRSLRPGSRKARLLYWILRRTCTSFVALSPAMAAVLERRGVDPDLIVVIPHAVAVPRGPEPDRARAHRVGVVCRLAPVKRVDLLIDVVAELERRRVECSALIVGDGAERPRLEARAAATGVGDRVRFVGEQHDVIPWLDEIDVFLVTSEVDVYPNAALEAMARGVPLVAMACQGGLADLAAEGGLLLPDREVRTAADAVARLFASRRARETLRVRGYGLVGRHRPDIVLSKLGELYGGREAAEATGTSRQ
jgi:glycosyltransferase involved in cell wall biosynthesis